MQQISTKELPENLQQLFTEVETQPKRATFGAMKGSGEILDDLIAPPVSPDTWEVLQ